MDTKPIDIVDRLNDPKLFEEPELYVAAMKDAIAEIQKLRKMLKNCRAYASKLEDRENAAPLVQTAED